MERLTQWIDENTAIPRVNLRICGIERCTTQLARYEDTGLTPEQIRKLKDRDTAVKPISSDRCNMCRNCCERLMPIDRFCPNCGQRINWEE